MHPELRIYLSNLRGGKTEEIQRELSSDFIDLKEPDLKFGEVVNILGKAYLTNEHLVIQLKVETEIVAPCIICNRPARLKLKVPQCYHTEELSEIRGKVYCYANPLREAILLEVPFLPECQRNCPKRKELEKYRPAEGSNDGIQFPFADLK